MKHNKDIKVLIHSEPLSDIRRQWKDDIQRCYPISLFWRHFSFTTGNSNRQTSRMCDILFHTSWESQ